MQGRSVAMASDAGSSSFECPVLSAWSQSQFVLQRLLKKDLLVISSGKLTRKTCVDNRELLISLINLVGYLTAFSDCSCVLCGVDR